MEPKPAAGLISVIIPTFNEAGNIAALIRHLQQSAVGTGPEIIVSDGGSTDDTLALAVAAGAVTLLSPMKGRAGQMNHGVRHASGDVLYFVHADTRPPQSCMQDIRESLAQGFNCGSFRFRFDNGKWLLRLNEFFTRFNYLFFRGGDQSIFVTRDLFQQVGGFREELRIMEDYDFLEKIWTQGRFRLVPKATLVSSRKYDTNSWLRVQLANLKVVRMYRKGAGQQEMIDTYHRMLQYRKNAF